MTPTTRVLVLIAAATTFAVPALAQTGPPMGAKTGAQTGPQASAQGSNPRAVELIRSAAQTELHAADNDHNNWTYTDRDTTDEKDATYEVIETPEGSLRRMVKQGNEPVSAAAEAQETARINAFVSDRDAQAKLRKAGAHDDDQARAMMKMLPTAFIWTIQSETADLITLAFRPNPDFHPPNIEARVMGTMAGELSITRPDNRIRTLRGALSDDVKIGYGVLGRLHKGGTFDIERREIAPHLWEITESRVHIGGHALLFKTIGQQEDEIKTNWKPSTAKTLREAAEQLNAK